MTKLVKRCTDIKHTHDGRVINPDTGPTPPGYNKKLRDASRWCLAFVSFSLMTGYSRISIGFCIISITLLHMGTSYSTKNWKWRIASWLSLPLCTIAAILRYVIYMIDIERAYSIYIILKICLHFLEFMWGGMIFLVLMLAQASASVKKVQNKDE